MQPDTPRLNTEADRPNDGGPPQVSPNDPIAPETHNAGGTYAEADFSPAAQRSHFQTEQYIPGPPHKRSETPEKRSGFEEAKRYQPVGGQATGK